jgi:hypothetical protein
MCNPTWRSELKADKYLWEYVSSSRRLIACHVSRDISRGGIYSVQYYLIIQSIEEEHAML